MLYITDDDADDRLFLTEALSMQGFHGKILTFENGEQLIAHLSAVNDLAGRLVLLDLNMPVKDGYETLKELRNNKNVSGIPIIILTSSSRAEDEQSCYKLGCNDFKEKPLSVSGYDTLARDIMCFSC